MKAATICAVALLTASYRLQAQESPAQRHEAATNQLRRITVEMSSQCLNDITTLEEWKNARPELRRQLLEMLGLDPLPKRSPLKAQVAGRLKRDAYTIEKIVFQSMPGLYVTGNFYVPRGSDRSRRRPSFISADIRRTRSARNTSTRIGRSGLLRGGFRASSSTRSSLAKSPGFITARTT